MIIYSTIIIYIVHTPTEERFILDSPEDALDYAEATTTGTEELEQMLTDSGNFVTIGEATIERKAIDIKVQVKG